MTDMTIVITASSSTIKIDEPLYITTSNPQTFQLTKLYIDNHEYGYSDDLSYNSDDIEIYQDGVTGAMVIIFHNEEYIGTHQIYFQDIYGTRTQGTNLQSNRISIAVISPEYTKKLIIKKNNDQITLLDESDIQNRLNDKLDVEDAFSGSYSDLSDKPDLSSKENTSNKVTSLSSSSTDTQYPSAKAVYDAIQAIPSPDMIEITTNKGTASALTMNKFYIEVDVEHNKRDVYYTEEDNGSYSWHKMDIDVLDDFSLDISFVEDEKSISEDGIYLIGGD